MADIRDFFSRFENESTASMAYLLLMANILGLVVYLDSRKTESVIHNQALTTNDKATIQSTEPQGLSEIKAASNVADHKQQAKDFSTEEAKFPKKIIETTQAETITLKNKKEQLKTADNVIDFKEAVATRTQEQKEPLKPLVWKFPKSIF